VELDASGSGQGTEPGCFKHSNELSGSMKCEGIS